MIAVELLILKRVVKVAIRVRYSVEEPEKGCPNGFEGLFPVAAVDLRRARRKGGGVGRGWLPPTTPRSPPAEGAIGGGDHRRGQRPREGGGGWR